MHRAKGHKRERIWAWYLRSARRDGAGVSHPRRSVGILIAVVVFVAWSAIWHVQVSKSEPSLAIVPFRLVLEHPICAAGFVLAFLVMDFRSTLLDYLAFSISAHEHVAVPEGLFGNEKELRRRYETTFGKDLPYYAPDLAGVISILLFLFSGLALMLSWR
jgi:hypothetical protein